jgi:hypothetical protein
MANLEEVSLPVERKDELGAFIGGDKLKRIICCVGILLIFCIAVSFRKNTDSTGPIIQAVKEVQSNTTLNPKDTPLPEMPMPPSAGRGQYYH